MSLTDWLSIVLVIITLAVSAGALTLIGHGAQRGELKFGIRKSVHPPKMKMNPKSALCEPGICQCDDALAYHKGHGECMVPGCPCQQFIPSNLDPEELATVTSAQLTRLAIESVNVRLDMEAKTAALEAATAARTLRAEMGTRDAIESTIKNKQHFVR